MSADDSYDIDVSGIHHEGFSTLHSVLIAHEAGDEAQMVLGLQELCTNLCLAGGDYFLRRHAAADCVTSLLHLILAEDSEVVQVLVMRALGLVADLVPRAALYIVNADGIPVILATFTERAHLLGNDGFRDDLFKCLEVVSFVAHEQIVAGNGLELLLGQIELGDEHQRVLITKTMGNLFALAVESEEVSFASVVPQLFALLSAKLSVVMMLEGRYSANENPGSGSSVTAMPRNIRIREEDIALKLLTCFAHFIDRIIISPAKFQRHSGVLTSLLSTCTLIIQESENTLQGEIFRLAAASIFSSLFFVVPQCIVPLLGKTNLLQAVCGATLTLIEDSMNDPRFGLDAANAVSENEDERDAADREDSLQRENSSVAVSSGSFGNQQQNQANADASNADEAFLRFRPREASIATLLEFLLVFIPAAPGTFDEYNVTVPFMPWQWLDDYRNRAEYEEDFSRRLECEYRLQHDSQAGLGKFEMFHVSRPCLIRFDVMSCLHGSTDSPPWTVVRVPLCSGFVHRPAMGLLFDQCTCVTSPPAGDSDDRHFDDAHSSDSETRYPAVDHDMLREWVLDYRKRRVEHRRHRINPLPPVDERLPDARVMQGGSDGDSCCCFLGRMFSSRKAKQPPVMPSFEHLKTMPSSISRYRDVREEVLLDPGFRALFVDHAVLGIIVRNCVPMLFTVLRCSVSQVITRHAVILLLRCISLASALDQAEAKAAVTPAGGLDGRAALQSNAATPVLRVTKDSEANMLVLEAFRAMTADMLLSVAGVVKGSTCDVVNRSTTSMLAASPQLARSPSAARGASGTLPLPRDGNALVSISVLTVQGEALLAGCLCIHHLAPFLSSQSSSVRAIFAQQRAINVLQTASVSILNEIAAVGGQVLMRAAAAPVPCIFHTTRLSAFREMAHAMSCVIQQLGGGNTSPMMVRSNKSKNNDDQEENDDCDKGERATSAANCESREMLGIIASTARTPIKSLPLLPDSGAMEQLLQLSHLVVECNTPIADVHRRNPAYFGITARAIKNQLANSTAANPSSLLSLSKPVSNQLLSLCIGLIKTIGSHVTFANSVLSEPVTISRVTPKSAKATAFAEQSPVLQCMGDRLSRPLRLRLVPLSRSPSSGDPNSLDRATPAASESREKSICVGDFHFSNVLPLSSDFVERLISAYSCATLRALGKELASIIEEEELLLPPSQPMRSPIGQCICGLLGTLCEHCEHQQRQQQFPLDDDDLDSAAPEDLSQIPRITEDNIVFVVDGHVALDPSMPVLDALVSHAASGAALKKLVESPSTASRSVLHRAMNTWISHHTIHFMVLKQPPLFRPSPAMCCSYPILRSRLKPSAASHKTLPAAGTRASASTAVVGEAGSCPSASDYMCSPCHIYISLKASSATDIIDECLQLLEATLAVLRLPAQCLSLGPDARRLCNALLREVASQSLSFASPCLSGLCHIGVHRESLEDSLPSYALWNYPLIFPMGLRNVVFDMVARARRQVMPRAVRSSAATSSGYHGIVGAFWANGQDTSAVKKIKRVVSRDTLLADGDFVLEFYDACPIPLEISFEGEPGTGVGPTLEFYTCLCRELQKRSLNLWRDHPGGRRSSATPDDGDDDLFDDSHALFPNPRQDASQRRYYRLLGCIIARMLFECKTFNLHLHPLLYKRILGNDLMDSASESLSSLDPVLESSLQRLLQMPPDDLAEMDLRCTVPGYEDVELYPMGGDMVVDAASVHSYVDAVRRFYLVRTVDSAVGSMLEGISALFAPIHLQLFSLQELTLRLRGPDGKIWHSRTQLEGMVRTDHGYSMSSATISYFLDTIAAWPARNQRLFLRFISGSDRIPIGGLAPPITIVRKDPNADATPSRASRMRAAAASATVVVDVALVGDSAPTVDDSSYESTATPAEAVSIFETPRRRNIVSEYQDQTDESLPTVNTCFHYLKLPQYSSREILEERLLTAIREGQESFLLS
jgi:hypothetical protein